MVYYRFQVYDSAGFNGTIYLTATNDSNNIFYRAAGEQLNLIFTKNLGGSSGHCKAIDYIFDKWFPQFRSQKPSCLSDPQNIIVEIGSKEGYGILLGNKLVMPDGLQYAYTLTPDSVHKLGKSYAKRPPVTQYLRLNDFSNSKLTYIGRRTTVR